MSLCPLLYPTSQILDYNVPGGKLNRGMAVYDVLVAILGSEVGCPAMFGGTDIVRASLLGGCRTCVRGWPLGRMHKDLLNKGFLRQLTFGFPTGSGATHCRASHTQLQTYVTVSALIMLLCQPRYLPSN